MNVETYQVHTHTKIQAKQNQRAGTRLDINNYMMSSPNTCSKTKMDTCYIKQWCKRLGNTYTMARVMSGDGGWESL